MFRSAATKIAHNSTIPALAGNQDLRPLQDLILAEKAVIISLQRLAADFSKAAEALKTWGLGEGDDLGNILGACTTIITHWTTAISQYASHGSVMREQLKAIRTREEHLDELRRRRRNLISKADSAEKKLQKMGPEHKNLVQQTDVLYRLRAEIGSLDVDIMSQEAATGDFKRTATRSWMGLKFGGLLECCEKGVIVGEYGKLVVAEIPEDETQPGLPRNPYFAYLRIDSLLGDTHRCVNDIRLSTVPSSAAQSRLQIPSSIEPTSLGTPFSANTRYQQYQQQSPTADSPYWHYDRQEPPNIGSGRVLDSPVDIAHPSLSFPSREPLYTGSLHPAGNLDEFGSSPGRVDVPSAGGAASVGRFATFPVRPHTASASGIGPGTYHVDTSPMRENESLPFSLLSTPSQREHSSSFTNSVNQALAAASGSHGQVPSGQEYSGVGSIQQENRCDDDDELLPPPGRPGRLSKDGPAPSYELSVHDSPLLRGVGDRSLVDGGARSSNPGTGKSGLALFDDGVISDDDDVETMSAHASVPIHSRPPINLTSSKPQAVHLHADRHVQFGVVSRIDSPDAPPAALPPMTPPDLTFSVPGRTITGEGVTFASEGGEGHSDTARRLEMSSEEKEKVLNAAAAREIALELQSQSQFQPSSNARDRSPTPGSLNLPNNTVGRTTDVLPLSVRERSMSPFGAENANVNSLPNLDKPAGFVTSGSIRRVPVPPSPPLKDERIEETTQWEFEGREEEEEVYNPYGETHAHPQQQREKYCDYESHNYGHERKGENRTMQPASITHEKYQDGPPGPQVEFKSSSSGSGLGMGKQQEPLEQPNAPFMRSGMGTNRSSSSLNGNGGGKVPAAVFKRPSPRLGSGSPISHSSLGQSQVSPAGGGDINMSITTTTAMPGPGNGLQKQERKETRELDVNQYRYINAYVDASNGGDSSIYPEEQHMNGSDAQRHGEGGQGYGQGKFTTNLEHEYDN